MREDSKYPNSSTEEKSMNGAINMYLILINILKYLIAFGL